MGIIQSIKDIFKGKEDNKDFDKRLTSELIITLKKDISRLEDEIKDLKTQAIIKDNKINELNEKLQNNNIKNEKDKTKLTKKENKLYRLYLEKQPLAFNDYMIIAGMKEDHLRVWVSRIRKKGYSVEFI